MSSQDTLSSLPANEEELSSQHFIGGSLFTIANILTFIRIFISPIFLLIYLQHDLFYINAQLLPYVLLFLLSASEISDALDGYLARKYEQVTDFGKIFDPMADSISRISIFLTFTQPPVNLPLLLVFVFIYRDSVISTLRTICALKGFTLAARATGKIKAVIQAIASFTIVLLMIPESTGYISSQALQVSAFAAVSIAAIYTVYSGVEYIVANGHYIKKLLVHKKSGN